MAAGRFTPYLKIGPGLAFYKIHIDSPFLTAYNVKGSDVSFAMALGAERSDIGSGSSFRPRSSTASSGSIPSTTGSTWAASGPWPASAFGL